MTTVDNAAGRDASVNPGAARSCSLCGSDEGFVFWEAAELPVHCNLLCNTREEALTVPRGDIRLAFCQNCAFIWNVAFEPQRMEYAPAYENSLHFSPRFQEYADALAERLIERYDLRGKTILEIACGKGDFLRSLCRRGDNRGIGFDPSYDPSQSDDGDTNRITFIEDFYSEHHAAHQADFIACRHALEHIADPLAFLRMIRANIGDRTDVVVFFEVPNTLYTLREKGIWDLIYEHCTYFVPASLRRCFTLAGFDVLNVSEEFGGQFLTIEARPRACGRAASAVPTRAKEDQTRLAADISAFGADYDRKLRQWRGRLAEMCRSGRRVVVWGAGSKGVTFLNIVRPSPQLEYMVDINPRKQGMYVAGTGQQIVAPEFLRRHRPDMVIVMNAIYADEIRDALGSMGLCADLMTA